MDLPPPQSFNPPTVQTVNEVADELDLYWTFVDAWFGGEDVPADITYFAKKHNCFFPFNSTDKRLYKKEIFGCGYNHKLRFIIKDGNKIRFASFLQNKKFSKEFKGIKYINTYPLK